MNAFPSLRKIIAISLFTFCAVSGIHAANYSPQNESIAQGQQQPIQNQPTYGGSVIYPQYSYPQYSYPQYPYSQYPYVPNSQTFPGSADFNKTYEHNQHPPQ